MYLANYVPFLKKISLMRTLTFLRFTTTLNQILEDLYDASNATNNVNALKFSFKLVIIIILIHLKF